MADEPIGNDTLKRLLELFDSEDATRFSPKVARLRSAIFTTTCAACGRPLDDTLHRCEQCGTRFCSAECEQGNSGHIEFCENAACNSVDVEKNPTTPDIIEMTDDEAVRLVRVLVEERVGTTADMELYRHLYRSCVSGEFKTDTPFLIWATALYMKHERLAIAACDATSDARCYICWGGGDLVRGCACRGKFSGLAAACGRR